MRTLASPAISVVSELFLNVSPYTIRLKRISITYVIYYDVRRKVGDDYSARNARRKTIYTTSVRDFCGKGVYIFFTYIV